MLYVVLCFFLVLFSWLLVFLSCASFLASCFLSCAFFLASCFSFLCLFLLLGRKREFFSPLNIFFFGGLVSSFLFFCLLLLSCSSVFFLVLLSSSSFLFYEGLFLFSWVLLGGGLLFNRRASVTSFCKVFI